MPDNRLKFKNSNTNVVHLWSAVAIVDTEKLNTFAKILSTDEQLKASRFRFKKDRSVYITARYLLRVLIGKYIDVMPQEIVFEYTAYGKPTYVNNKELNFNVSHSADRIVIGFSINRTIGVDIEKIKYDFCPLELAQNFFAKEEITALSKIKESEKHQAFYRCWTRKESFVKAVGEGLSYPLDSFAVTIEDDNQAHFIKINNKNESKVDWQLYSFAPAKGFIAAITTQDNSSDTIFFNGNCFLK